MDISELVKFDADPNKYLNVIQMKKQKNTSMSSQTKDLTWLWIFVMVSWGIKDYRQTM